MFQAVSRYLQGPRFAQNGDKLLRQQRQRRRRARKTCHSSSPCLLNNGQQNRLGCPFTVRGMGSRPSRQCRHREDRQRGAHPSRLARLPQTVFKPPYPRRHHRLARDQLGHFDLAAQPAALVPSGSRTTRPPKRRRRTPPAGVNETHLQN